MIQALNAYTAIISDLTEMVETKTGISERSFRLDLRLLQNPIPELQALKQWVSEQKEPLTFIQLRQILDDLMNQLYQLYNSKKRESYPFTKRIWEEFLNRDAGPKGSYQDLVLTKTGYFGEKHYKLGDTNLS
ncbi:MAG: hypothetical protein NTX38_14245 [Methylobacter sp.]|nr:hypothetical protein [Methylobacter sp.]